MLFILKNHPFYEQFNRQTGNNILSSKNLHRLELQMKKRLEKTQAFNPDECFDESDLTNDVVSIGNSEYNSNLGMGLEKSLERTKKKSKSIDSYQMHFVQKKKNRIKDKITFYKKLVKIFDITAVFLILLGAILSLYEHELYYFHNLIYRVPGVLMKDYIYRNPSNHSLKAIFDGNNLNLNLLTNFHIENYRNEFNSWKSNNSADNIDGSFENFFILKTIGISKFSYSETLTDPSRINIPIEIPEFNNSLRIVILISTCISCILILFSRYIEHIRNYLYKKELHVKFYKGEYFYVCLLEIFLILPIQYPGINSYVIFVQLGSTICLPFTSILSAISVFRFLFVYKIFKNLTIWNSEYAEWKCEKFACQADTKFALKALQKENPFFTLGIIFVLTCVCFGFSLRNFELHFWEAQNELNQNWRYHWNAIWCIFVSMTTVGYGDFYPKTHLGRFIIIVACVFGIYFVSMTMVFMTGRSVLNEPEMKAYKLIVRLKLRTELKDIEAKIILHSFNIARIKTKLKSCRINKTNDFEKKLDVLFSYERRCIFSLIEEKKKKERNLNNLQFTTTKEQLIDISERIDRDIKEIKNNLDVISYLNETVLQYSSTQAGMLRYLRKNVFSMESTFTEILRNPENFGVLAKFDKNILSAGVFENNKVKKNSCQDLNENYPLNTRPSMEYLGEERRDYNIHKSKFEISKKDFLFNDSKDENSQFSTNKNLKIDQKIFTSSNEEMIKFKNNKRPSKEIKANNHSLPETVDSEEKIPNKSKSKGNLISLKQKKVAKYIQLSLSSEHKIYSDISNNEDINSCSRKQLSTFRVSDEEIKSHFNFLFMNPSEGGLNNDSTKINDNYLKSLQKHKDSSGKDQLIIKSMIGMRRISARKVNILKK